MVVIIIDLQLLNDKVVFSILMWCLCLFCTLCLESSAWFHSSAILEFLYHDLTCLVFSFFFSFGCRGWSQYEEHHFSLPQKQLPLIFLLDKIWKRFSSQQRIGELLSLEDLLMGAQVTTFLVRWNWFSHTMIHPLFKPNFFLPIYKYFFLRKEREQSLHWHQVLYQSILHCHPWFNRL